MSARGKFSCQASSLIAVAAAAVLLFLIFSGQQGPGTEPGTAVGKTTISSDAFNVYETTSYRSSAKVIEQVVVEKAVSIGISSGTGSIDFGEIPAGSNYARREISLANLEAAPASIYLSAEGDISPHVSFERNGFVLGGGANATVGVFFSAQSAEVGDYSGEMTVQIKRPKYAALPIIG